MFKTQLKNISLVAKGVNAYRVNKQRSLYKSIFKRLRLPEKPLRKALIYPNEPSSWNAIRSTLNILNFELTHKVTDNFLFAIKWHDATFKDKNKLICEIANTVPVLNINSIDISKKRVDQLHQEIFGYNTEINPTTFQGKCVQKSNINSSHDGKLIQCPIQEIQEDTIYQIHINTQVQDKYVEDIRVPFYKDHIPFVYLKYKLVEDQFISKTQKAIIKEPEEVFSKDEIEKIITLALKMGLDFAEMDVLRHRDDNRIYVIDVNDTPGGLPKNSRGTDILSPNQKKEALYRMTKAFYDSFLKEIY